MAHATKPLRRSFERQASVRATYAHGIWVSDTLTLMTGCPTPPQHTPHATTTSRGGGQDTPLMCVFSLSLKYSQKGQKRPKPNNHGGSMADAPLWAASPASKASARKAASHTPLGQASTEGSLVARGADYPQDRGPPGQKENVARLSLPGIAVDLILLASAATSKAARIERPSTWLTGTKVERFLDTGFSRDGATLPPAPYPTATEQLGRKPASDASSERPAIRRLDARPGRLGKRPAINPPGCSTPATWRSRPDPVGKQGLLRPAPDRVVPARDSKAAKQGGDDAL